MGQIWSPCSHLPKSDRSIHSRVTAIWTPQEGWDGCAEAQFYEKEEEIQYIEWTCYGIKGCIHPPKTIAFADIVEVLHEESWKKKSLTNGGFNPSEEQYLHDVLLLKMRNGHYFRMAPMNEEEAQQIKDIIDKMQRTMPQRNAPQRQSIQLSIVKEGIKSINQSKPQLVPSDTPYTTATEDVADIHCDVEEEEERVLLAIESSSTASNVTPVTELAATTTPVETLESTEEKVLDPTGDECNVLISK